MDHWGDPWADDSITTKFPAEEQVETKRTQEAAPVVLSGFDDEAQWGDWSKEEGSGEWGSAVEDVGDVGAEGDESITREDDAEAQPTIANLSWSDTIGDDGIECAESALSIEGNRGSLGEDTSRSSSAFQASDFSDSGTTIRPEQETSEQEQGHDAIGGTDDDVSTGPSTSPSEISHLDVQTESPRTSFEDEQAVSKPTTSTAPTPLQEISIPEVQAGGKVVEAALTTPEVNREEADFDVFGTPGIQDESPQDDIEEDDQKTPSTPIATTLGPRIHEGSSPPLETPQNKRKPSSTVAKVRFEPDYSLLSRLFPPSKSAKEYPPVPEDAMSTTTSAKKAWYHITRKETMRQFNSGKDDDNYVRVTWANSQVKAEVNKIVTRWRNEDRFSGRTMLGGKGAGGMFFWDQPAPSEPKIPSKHSRTRTSISSAIPAVAAAPSSRLSMPPLASEAPTAQFNWSTATPATEDPWRADSPVSRLSMAIEKSPEATEALPPPLNLSSSIEKNPDSRPPSMEIAGEPTPKALTTQQKFFAVPPPSEGDPWASLGRLDTSPQNPQSSANTAKEEDDEWGEMVESPAVPATPTLSSAMTSLASATSIQTDSSPPPTTPHPAKHPPPLHPQASRHASPIVRLKGTISPTSSRPNYMSFLPPSLPTDPVPHSTPPKSKPPTSAPSIELPSDSTNATPVPSDPLADPLATADFSIFESEPAPIKKTSPPISHMTEPKIPQRRSSRAATQPSHLPSSPVADDERMIREIIQGLPDLSYMLR